MHNQYLHTEYLAPKWRAYVTPAKNGFHFSNGLTVSSMWELKQALLTFGDDVLSSHISEDSHQIADWVEHVVKDKDLGDELRKHTHRWGMVVALERQMMRTLNLPNYVANRWLATSTTSFVFANGEEILSLRELQEKISSIPDETLQFHFQRHPNDLSMWLSHVVGDYYLAESLEEASSKDQMMHIIQDHLEMVLDAAQS